MNTSNGTRRTSIKQHYDDVLQLLSDHGYSARITDDGGHTEAIEIGLSNTRWLHVTDVDGVLPWYRADHHDWGVGIYDEAGCQLHYAVTADGSAQGLLGLIAGLEQTSIVLNNTVS